MFIIIDSSCKLPIYPGFGLAIQKHWFVHPRWCPANDSLPFLKVAPLAKLMNSVPANERRETLRLGVL